MNIRKRIGALELAQGQGKSWEHLTDAELEARISELSAAFRLEHGFPDDLALTAPLVREVMAGALCGVAV